MTARRATIEKILSMADRLFRNLWPAVPRELLELEVTMPQLKIMVILYIQSAIRMGNIAEDLQVSMATATGLVDRLVDRGLVVREGMPDDRRVVLVRLSEGGMRALNGVWETASEHSRELLESLDIVHLNMFQEVLQIMLETAEYESSENKIKAHKLR